MQVIAAVLGVVLVLVVLWEAFETIIFPRRVTRRFRLTRMLYRYSWRPYAAVVTRITAKRNQESFLSFYGPASLIALVGFWAIGLIIGFGLLIWSSDTSLRARSEATDLFTALYMSGTNFFTLGLGDVTPGTSAAKVLTVVEAGTGFGFLALIISYLPALNQSFSRREARISLLDARAGSPPTAAEMMLRHSYDHGLDALRVLFLEWETWSAELLESHLSYPVLAYFRSQHDNHSWLAALTSILDASALVMVGVEGACARQAELTFAIARHAVVDLSIVFKRPPMKPLKDRLSDEDLEEMRKSLKAAGLRFREGDHAARKLADLRNAYEPYVYSLSRYFRMALPPWILKTRTADNWQTSAWEKRALRHQIRDEERHF